MLAENENRVFQRMNGEFSVRYSPLGTDGEFCSTTRNISGGGIRMPLLKKLKPGTTVDLEIFRHNTDMVFKCIGKVVWMWDNITDEKEERAFEAGIKFLNPDLFYIGRLMDSLKNNSILV